MIPRTEKSMSANGANQPSCDGVLTGPCTPEAEAVVQTFCDSGSEITSCTTSCDLIGTICTLMLEDGDVDACTEPFTYGNKTWTSLSEYCSTFGFDWRDCMRSGLDATCGASVFGTHTAAPLMPGDDADAAARYFTSQAATAFGPGRYLVEAIVFDPRFDCELGSGQSYATNIARAIGDPNHLFPLCGSYAPALGGVLDFAQTLIKTDFLLTLAEDEHVTAVIVISQDGTERALLATE